MESPGALPSGGLVFQLVCGFRRYWSFSSKSTVRPRMEPAFKIEPVLFPPSAEVQIPFLKGPQARMWGQELLHCGKSGEHTAPEEAAWRRLTHTGGEGASTPASPPTGVLPEPLSREPGRGVCAPGSRQQQLLLRPQPDTERGPSGQWGLAHA